MLNFGGVTFGKKSCLMIVEAKVIVPQIRVFHRLLKILFTQIMWICLTYIYICDDMFLFNICCACICDLYIIKQYIYI